MLTTLKLVIWDLDGTLVHTVKDVTASVNAALAHFGVAPVNESTVRTGIGPGIEVLFGHVLGQPESRIPELIQQFVAHYQFNYSVHSEPFEGVKTVLSTVKSWGLHQAVLTNKPEYQSRNLLTEVDLIQHFDTIVGPDTYNIAKPDPGGLLRLMETYDVSPSETIMIGDGDTDVAAAHAANVSALAVTYGYRTHAELSVLSPTFFAENLDQVLTILNAFPR